MNKQDAKVMRGNFIHTYINEQWARASHSSDLGVLDRHHGRWYADALRQFKREYPTLQSLIGD